MGWGGGEILAPRIAATSDNSTVPSLFLSKMLNSRREKKNLFSFLFPPALPSTSAPPPTGLSKVAFVPVALKIAALEALCATRHRHIGGCQDPPQFAFADVRRSKHGDEGKLVAMSTRRQCRMASLADVPAWRAVREGISFSLLRDVSVCDPHTPCRTPVKSLQNQPLLM